MSSWTIRKVREDRGPCSRAAITADEATGLNRAWPNEDMSSSPTWTAVGNRDVLGQDA